MGYVILCDEKGQSQLSCLMSGFPGSQHIIQGGNVTYKIATDNLARGMFQQKGVLDNQTEGNFRAINDNFVVFAISRDLGTIQATQAPVVWAVGYTTDPAINYTDLSGAPPTQRSLYYKSQYADSDDGALVSRASLGNEILCLTSRYRSLTS